MLGRQSGKSRLYWLSWVVGSALGLFLCVIGLLQIPAVGHAVDNPALCSLCHVMQAQYQDHLHSPHRQLSCNDCHVAHGPVAQVVTKADSGARHTAIFLSGRTPTVIKAHAKAKTIIQHNCERCHTTKLRNVNMQNGAKCVHCHRDISHARPYRR